jgi:hypothetical protein
MIRPQLASFLFVTASLAACGGSSSTTADAPAGAIDANTGPDADPTAPDAYNPFACAGRALPPTAPATIVVMGTTSTITLQGTDPVLTVDVGAYPRAGGAALATAVSSGTGTFQLTVPTGGVPLDGYILAKKATYLDTYLYAPTPLAADTNQARMLMLTSQQFQQLQAIAMTTQSAGKGVVGIVVSDCDNHPLAGVTVTASSGTVIYNKQGLPSIDATATGADGVALIFNVTPGSVTVGATGGAGAFRSHAIDVRADVVTTTAVQP